MQISFAGIKVESDLYQLHRDGELVPIEPLLFSLLIYFIDNTDRVISRDELIEAVWKGRIVSDTTISGAIKGLRQALGDSGKKQQFIKTIHGRGFDLQLILPSLKSHPLGKKIRRRLVPQRLSLGNPR